MCSTALKSVDRATLPRKSAILCVDDSQEMLLICKTMLEAGDCEVFTAADGQAGLQALQQHSIDLAVIDDRMPGMRGAELARAIKRIYKDLPIIMFSGSKVASESLESLESVDFFVSKSNGPIALRKVVRSLLERRAAGNYQ